MFWRRTISAYPVTEHDELLLARIDRKLAETKQLERADLQMHLERDWLAAERFSQALERHTAWGPGVSSGGGYSCSRAWWAA